MTHSDQKYVDALLHNNHLLISEIYTRFTPKVISFVKKNSGNETEARDLIQEVLLIIYDQAKTKNLQLTCPFDAYFFLICKRKWYTILQKKSKNRVTDEPITGFISENVESQVDETVLFEKKNKLFEHFFEKLGEACKKLLKLTFSIKSMEEVAEKLGVSYGYARKKKSLCIGKLTKMVQESSMYKQLKT